MRAALVMLSLSFLVSCSAAPAGAPPTTSTGGDELQTRIGEALGPEVVAPLAHLDDWSRITIESDDRNLAAVNILPDDPVKGPKDAPVTVVIFSDFQCPFCSRHELTVEKVLEKYEGLVRVTFKQYPLRFHNMARPAARAALAAHEQGQFWIMHDVLFANNRDLHYANFVKWAGELEMDVDRFKKVIDDPATDQRINVDIQEAKAHGVQGTPTLFINGVMVMGAVPAEDLDAYVKLALARAWVALNQGVPQKDLYTHLTHLPQKKKGTTPPPAKEECGFDYWGLPLRPCK